MQINGTLNSGNLKIELLYSRNGKNSKFHYLFTSEFHIWITCMHSFLNKNLWIFLNFRDIALYNFSYKSCIIIFQLRAYILNGTK